MSLKSNFSGVVTAGVRRQHSSTDDDLAVKRAIQRRDVYKGGDKRSNRNSLRVSHNSLDRFDYPDSKTFAKSAPGSGRTSPDFLSLSTSLAIQKSWTPGSMTGQPIEAKVVILGAQGVGKTSIVLRYVGKVFSNRVNSTIGASFFTFTMDIDSSKVKIQLWDTAGQERFRSMAPMYYRRANAAIIVYDITNSKSFEQAKDWVAELHKNVGSDIALCIVGNKVDLPKDLRKVSTEKGKEFAKSLNAEFAETSAALDIGVRDMFTRTAMRVINLEQQDSRHQSSYLSHSHTHTRPEEVQQQHEHLSPPATSSPNIQLSPAPPEKKGWCCWR